MLIADAVQVVIGVLEYVLPATFVWSLTHIIVSAVVKAATGRTGKVGL